MSLAKTISDTVTPDLDLAPVLLVDDDVASRLTLQTLLRAGGYSVDIATSAAEAVEKLDNGRYSLVLSDLGDECDEGRKVLAYARLKDYKPATASVTEYHGTKRLANGRQKKVFVETEDIVSLLAKVAELIGLRATRRVERQLRHSYS